SRSRFEGAASIRAHQRERAAFRTIRHAGEGSGRTNRDEAAQTQGAQEGSIGGVMRLRDRNLLLILLLVLLIAALPMWPYSTGWGYFPSGGLLLLLVVLLIIIVGDRRRILRR